MDPTQRQMLDFEQNWYALGGGSSREISSQFGLSDRCLLYTSDAADE